MKLAIIGAMEEEITFLKEKIFNLKVEEINKFTFFVGNIFEHDVILVKSGIGRSMAGLLMGVLFSHFENIDKVINVGIAGGHESLELGDIVVADKIVYGDVNLNTESFPYPFGQMAGCPRTFVTDRGILELSRNYDCVIGDVCTCDSFTTSKEKVKEIRDQHFKDLNVLCFDMESASFAQCCFFYNTDLVVIRSISDIIGSMNQSEQYDSNEVTSSVKCNLFLYELLKRIKN